MIITNDEVAVASETDATEPPTVELWDALIKRWDAEHGEKIIAGLMGRGFSRHDAEDAKQEALHRAFQCLSEGAFPSSVRGWLFTLAWHAAEDSRRMRRRERVSWLDLSQFAVAGCEADPFRGLCRRERNERVERAIETLTPRQREAVRLYFKEKARKAEIARRLGTSPSAVNGLLERAIHRLRKELGAWEDGFSG